MRVPRPSAGRSVSRNDILRAHSGVVQAASSAGRQYWRPRTVRAADYLTVSVLLDAVDEWMSIKV